MNKIIKTIAAALGCATMTLASCSDDTFRIDPAGEADGALHVEYLVDGEVRETRSVQAVDDEIRLSSALILFYSLDTGKALCYSYVKPSAGRRTISFDPPAELRPDVEYNTLVLGNPDNYTGGASVDSYARSIMDLDYSAARMQILYTRTAAIVRDNPGELPMYGQFVDAAKKTPKTFRYRAEGSLISTEGIFFFSRAVSRIDLENFVPSTLMVESVRVINYQSQGYPLTEGLRGSNIIDYQHVGTDGWISVEPAEAGAADQRLSSALYCFPNIVVASQPDDKVTTALLIKGKYCEGKDGGVYDEESTYYRFNLTNTGAGQVLSRNYAYKASIKGVKRRGSATPDAAVNDHLPIFDYDISDEWQAADNNAASDDKGNYLLLSKTFVTFEGDDSSANVVNLRVQTNHDLHWSVTPDDSEESIDNSKFICEKVDDNTLRVSPTESNNTPHVRFGRFTVTAVSASDPTVALQLSVNLQHLTTEFNYTMLTVDGCTGTIEKRLNPNGGKLLLKVQTGSASNVWLATDENNAIKNWGLNSNVSDMGLNGADLEINYDPNISGSERRTRIKVYLDPSINDDNAVKPVYVDLVQDVTAELFSISPAPVDGVYTVDCCSYNNIPSITPQIGNKDASRFTLTVSPAAGVEMEVKHNFISRDISINTGGFGAVCTESSTERIKTDKALFTSMGKTSSPATYYINAAAMAPGDPAITGYQLYIIAKDPVSGTTQERVVSFRLTAMEGEVNDVILKLGNTYILLSDRNSGSTPRIGLSGQYVEPKYYTPDNDGIIPGFQGENKFSAYTEWAGQQGDRDGQNYMNIFKIWIRDYNYDEEKIYSPFYLKSEINEWVQLMGSDCNHVVAQSQFSKGRAYLMSDFPRITRDGRKVTIFRWFPQIPAICGDGGFKFTPDANFYTIYNSNVMHGVPLLHRKLTKDEVKNYLLDYLGYTEATLPDELK